MQFMALGGTDSVGASCYYIELAGVRILLDCGKGILAGGKTYAPNYGQLLTQAGLGSPNSMRF